MTSERGPGETLPDGKLADATVTVMCQNEERRIGTCLASIAEAGRGMHLAVDVIVNGSTDNSVRVALQASRDHRLDARVFRIEYGDKSNAINRAIHDLRRPARLHVFADAYAVLAPAALRALGQTLSLDSHAEAVTGVASNGRTMQAATASTLNEGGRINGQLHAFRPAFLDRMVAAGIRLPVSLYRGDSLLASMVCHDLDAAGQDWDSRRAAASPDAVFEIPRLSPFRPRDIVRQFRRKVRQMRGRLENEAIKSIIYRDGFAALPGNADDMIAAWLADGGRVVAALSDRPFLALALRRHADARRPTAEELWPQRVPV